MEKLTIERALKEVRDIYYFKEDEEIAHGVEDDLRGWFIESCAKGLYTKKEMIKIGKIVASTENIDFARWTA